MIRVWRFFSTALNNFNLYFYLYFFKWIFWSHIFSILQLFGLLGLFQRSSAPYFRICQSECIDLSISPNIFAFYFCEMNTFPYLLNFTYPLCLSSKLFLYCSTTVRLFFFVWLLRGMLQKYSSTGSGVSLQLGILSKHQLFTRLISIILHVTNTEQALQTESFVCLKLSHYNRYRIYIDIGFGLYCFLQK